MKILAIGAHYDDIEIGCGGTLFKHNLADHDIYLAITSSDEFRTGPIEDRRIEQLRSAITLGVKRENLLSFSYRDDLHNIIGDLDKLNADIIFAQHEFDTHQDHRRASIIAQAAGRKRQTTTLFYDSGSSYDFKPNVFSLIDFGEKYDLLLCFQSQIDCGAINVDIVEKKNAYFASLITEEKNKHAEGFIARKLIWQI